MTRPDIDAHGVTYAAARDSALSDLASITADLATSGDVVPVLGRLVYASEAREPLRFEWHVRPQAANLAPAREPLDDGSRFDGIEVLQED